MTLLRGARGRSLSRERLFGAVPLALATASCRRWQRPTPANHACGWPGRFAGVALGAVRGSFLKLQVDRRYSRLRLAKGRDGHWGARTLVFLPIFAIGAQLARLPTPAPEVGATGLVAACAGYPRGRATTLWRRSLSAPHQSHSPP